MLAFLTTLFRFFWSYRSTAAQDRSLLHTIAMAKRYRVPLPDAVEALSQDETGYHAYRVAKLAAILRSGDSLKTALEKVPYVMSESSRTHVLFGIESGELEAATRGAITTLDDRPGESLQFCYESLIRLAIVAFIMLLIITFIMTKIVPTLKAIFDDFALDISEPMEWSIDLSEFFASYGALFIIGAIVALLWIRFGDPIRLLRRGFISRWMRRFIDLDTPNLLRQLAVARESGKPLSGAISTLARCYHGPAGRQELLRVWNDIEQGDDTWSALQRQRLITSSEASVIRASETLNNTPWALRQLADQRQTRSMTRLRILTRLLPSLALIPIAAVVALLAIGLLGSLSKLVLALT